jgi:hypothetical protein
VTQLANKQTKRSVAPDFRSVKKISPGVALRNHQPIYRGLGALGAGLIYKAVSMAHALGCKEFLATVQHQNARFFQRLIGLVAAPRSAAGACIDHILFKIKILKIVIDSG